MKKLLTASICLVLFISCNPRLSNGLRRKDLHKDVAVITTKGTFVIRLSDSTPLHRDNFLKLAKSGFYDSLQFHRVIRSFMIQSGDEDSRHDYAGFLKNQGPDGPGVIPAEFRTSLFHKRGALGAARTGDDVNPTKSSSRSQFYIVQGKKFTDGALDTLEMRRLKGRKIPEAQRRVYKEIGGAPHLDQNYTVFGEVTRGMDVVDSIAAVPTSGAPLDRPIKAVRILKMRLVHRRG